MQTKLSELDDEIAHSDRPDLRDEREAIASYLARAIGLSGRNRTTGSHSERARVAVRKAIVAALAKIAEADPWLGRHLRDRVRTGFECRYESDPDHPIRWILGAAPHAALSRTPRTLMSVPGTGGEEIEPSGVSPPEFRSISYLHPHVNLITQAPIGFQIHVTIALALFTVSPFTRLVPPTSDASRRARLPDPVPIGRVRFGGRS